MIDHTRAPVSSSAARNHIDPTDDSSSVPPTFSSDVPLAAARAFLRRHRTVIGTVRSRVSRARGDLVAMTEPITEPVTGRGTERRADGSTGRVGS